MQAAAPGSPPRPQPAVPALTIDGLPNVRSGSALAIDMDTGAMVYGKNPDAVRAIASTGKIFVAMVARRRGIDLDGVTEITMDDVQYARGGSRTHLDLRRRFRNHDLLRAMLIASDNRAATALGRAVGLTPGAGAEMNALALDLGLKRTTFTDPTGLNGNWSTAREMARALRAMLRDPVLAEILATKFASVSRSARAACARSTTPTPTACCTATGCACWAARPATRVLPDIAWSPASS